MEKIYVENFYKFSVGVVNFVDSKIHISKLQKLVCFVIQLSQSAVCGLI